MKTHFIQGAIAAKLNVCVQAVQSWSPTFGFRAPEKIDSFTRKTWSKHWRYTAAPLEHEGEWLTCLWSQRPPRNRFRSNHVTSVLERRGANRSGVTLTCRQDRCFYCTRHRSVRGPCPLEYRPYPARHRAMCEARISFRIFSHAINIVSSKDRGPRQSHNSLEWEWTATSYRVANAKCAESTWPCVSNGGNNAE